MADNIPVTKTHQVTIKLIEPGKDADVKNITVEGIGNFDYKFSNVYNSLAEQVSIGRAYGFRCERGPRKNNFTERQEEFDYMFFWNLRGIDQASNGSAPVPTQAQPTQDNVVYGTPQPSQYDMRQAAIMYQNMYGNVSAVGATHEWDGAMTFAEKLDEIGKEADRMFNLKYKPILGGQLPLEPEPEPEEDDPF
jgi:hypothetical protein